MMRFVSAAAVSLMVAVATASTTDVWESFVAHAQDVHGDVGKRAAEFLREHRPERDADIDLDILVENLDLALDARKTFPWASEVPEEIFFNDVLPYVVLDETRESWRPDMYRRAASLVESCATAAEAAQTLNRTLFNDIDVHYNTGRKRPNQSPSESMEQGRATCTGLSIILVDACRAIGVPARVAGVASWHDKRGNHTWVEIWDGAWHFTGADEYDRNGLNRGWFVNDASRAKQGDPIHAVWASSWRTTGHHFPMVWNMSDHSVPAVDVTPTYAGDADSDGTILHVRTWDTRGGERVVCSIEVSREGELLAEGSTKAGTADLNDMPALAVPPGVVVTVEANREGATYRTTLRTPRDGASTRDLYLDRMEMSASDAEDRLAALAEERRSNVVESRAAELEAREMTLDGATMRWLERTYGDAPAGARSLWISMHGGGGAPANVNDQQWRNQIRLYEPSEGIYIAPRAPSDTWNLWHQGHIDPLFDRLVETYVTSRGVDPNRVYLMGYSAGGDGVYQLAPRMADRFAAASMMAGHPNEARPLGLRNLPFAIFMGGDDHAYDRATVAARWGEELKALRDADPDGYPHRVTIYEGLGHWMQRKDAEALPWMAAQTRNPWPDTVVWYQDDVTNRRFYWLAVDEPVAGSLIRAHVDGQTIVLESDDVSSVTLRLRDALIDLERPIIVKVGDRIVHEGRVPRTEAAIRESLEERADPTSAATATLHVSW